MSGPNRRSGPPDEACRPDPGSVAVERAIEDASAGAAGWAVRDARRRRRPAFGDAPRRDYMPRLSDTRAPGCRCRSGVAIAAPERAVWGWLSSPVLVLDSPHQEPGTTAPGERDRTRRPCLPIVLPAAHCVLAPPNVEFSPCASARYGADCGRCLTSFARRTRNVHCVVLGWSLSPTRTEASPWGVARCCHRGLGRS